MRLTKKDEPFVWESEQQLICKMMKIVFTTSPALFHADNEREDIIKTDVSNYLSAEVLSA
jgi:hypothetical protein